LRKIRRYRKASVYYLLLLDTFVLNFTNMAAKKVKTTIKVNLPAGEASPAPPLGPALGQHGVAIMDFVRAYNEKTADMKGQIVPAVITIYEDRSFDFEIKKAPVSEMIKKVLKLEKGSGETPRETVGKLSQLSQVPLRAWG
jgi:large subunit ribosomal protein L11